MSTASARNWDEVVFDRIIEDSAFGPRFSGDAYDENGNIATLRTTDISEDGRISYETMPLAQLDEASFAKHLLKINDLVITRSGRVGTTALFTGYHLPVLPGAFLIRFRLSDRANPDFYRYWFNSRVGQQRLASIARGAAQQNINITNVKTLQVPLPPLSVQSRIATILSAYDDLIENNQRRIQLLEQAARLLYKEWFVHLRFPGHEHTKIQNGILEGWEKKNLFDVATLTYGFSFKSALFNEQGDGLPVTRIRDIPPRESKTYTTEDAPKDKLLKDGDFVIGMDGDFHMNFWTGGKAWINQRVVRIAGEKDVSTAYLRFACEKQIKDFNATIVGTTVAHLGAKHLKLIEVLVPPKIILSEVQSILDSIQCQIVFLSNQNKLATKARDLLLPRLMNGEAGL